MQIEKWATERARNAVSLEKKLDVSGMLARGEPYGAVSSLVGWLVMNQP